MAEPALVAGAVAAGSCVAMAPLALSASATRARSDARAWLDRRRRPARPARVPIATRMRDYLRSRRGSSGGQWLQLQLDRAGWRETPERYVVSTVAAAGVASLVLGGAGLVSSPAAGIMLGLLGGLGTLAGSAALLLGAARRRRERLLAELPPLLELVGLELSSGVSAQSAIESVVARIQSGLAAELKQQLVASQVAGSASFEMRMAGLGRRMELPALVSLAGVIATAREYGSGVAPGVRALAIDLRRAQRRRLIMLSRRALNRILIPSAIGVLLPFMAVLLFPAVSTLMHATTP